MDEALDLFYDLLTPAIQDHIPRVTLRRRYAPWFDAELRAILREKEAAHRRLKRNRSEENVRCFGEKRRDFKRLAGTKFTDYLKGLVCDLKSNPKRFWSYLKCLRGKNLSIPSLVDGNNRIENDSAKAELLNRTFAAKFSDPNVRALPLAPEYNVENLSSFEIVEETIRSTLLSTNRHKACGPDDVSARIIHECAEELVIPIAKLCRLSLEQGVFPSRWKRANIVPIFKKGAKSRASNYRSVSLTPLSSKVLEKAVYISLLSHVRPVLADQQHGFMSGRSCVTNLGSMLRVAWNNISAGSQTDVIYTDFSSAFQSVNHKLLLHKLENSFKINGSALQWLKSYLSGREQRVVVNGHCSAWVPVTSGTPEGGHLSPLLFSCFINDLPTAVQSDCMIFADDCKLFRKVDSAADVNELQADIDKLCEWSDKWKLTLNASKCKTLTLTLRTKPVLGNYLIDNSELERVSEMRDLGVIIDAKLTFQSHIDDIIRKANRALGLLIRSFQTGKNGPSLHGTDNKSLIVTFCANVRSILEYGCVIWGGAADTHLKRADKIQHKFLIWLCARCRVQNVSLEYSDLLRHFGMASLSARRLQYDILFIRNIHNHKIDSPYLLEAFPLAVPPRVHRHWTLFNVPFARTNTIKSSMFVRIPRVCNRFLDANRDVDVWNTSLADFKKRVKACIMTI